LSIVLLILFGILGALARYSLELLIQTPSFPLATLLINLIGCFLLAFVTRFLIWLPFLSSKLVSAISTGFVGSFTTFSTFALESSHLLQSNLFVAAVYLVASAGGGFYACLLGYRTSKSLLSKRRTMRHVD
jgi:CrcB protein